MKFKALISQGSINIGDTVEGIKSPLLDQCCTFDSGGLLWYFYAGQYEEVGEMSQYLEQKLNSVKDVLGQEMQSIHFK